MHYQKITQINKLNIQIDKTSLSMLTKVADGDARRALNFLEIACDLSESQRFRIAF